MVDGRTHALPDDIQAVLPAVIEHRLRTVQDQRTRESGYVSETLLNAVPIP
jgi:MoxR-like ATPase